MPDAFWRRFLWLAVMVISLGGCSAGSIKHPVASQPAMTAVPSRVTGITACDTYLASYQACHRAARIYPPDQITAHYQTMRDSLLQSSQDSTTRAQLSARCLALSAQEQQMLQGRSCATEAASTTH
jgi:hypothetical protein